MEANSTLKEQVGRFKKNWSGWWKVDNGLSRVNVQVLILGGIIALTVAVSISVLLWWGSRDYRPLYGSGESYNVAAIVALLDKRGIAYRVHPDGGQLMVRSADIPAARMAMAEGGIAVPLRGKMRFDERQQLGSSHFMEQSRYLHALEEELAKTVLSIQSVRLARVHLAVPEQSPFLRKQPSAKAAVYVELYSGSQLSPTQVAGVVRLVSNSVPALDVGNVSVIDQFGNPLGRSDMLESGEGAEGEAPPLRYLGARQNLERYLEGQVRQILIPLTGPDHYRVNVAVELDMDKLEQTSETFGSDTVVRSEMIEQGDSSSEEGRDRAAAAQEPSVTGTEEGGAKQPGQKLVRNYEVPRHVSTESHRPGQIRRLTVAVLLDAERFADLGDRLSATLDQIRALVRQAVGYSEARGDEVSLGVLSFAKVPEPVLPKESLWSAKNIEQYSGLLMALALLVAAVALLLYIGKLRRELQHAVSTGGRRATAGGEEGGHATEATSKATIDSTGMAEGLDNLDVRIENSRQLAARDPAKVAAVLKQWVD